MRDIYFYLMVQSWNKIFFLIFASFILLNIAFGTLYYVVPQSLSLSNATWWDCFFFSVQTISTIGYGAMAPTGLYSNILVSIEAGIGIIFTAVVTGIVFSKFSRPSSKVLFSGPVLINKHNGQRVLTFRVGNTRGNDIVDASMTVNALVDETSPEGTNLRCIKELKLERTRSSFFLCLGFFSMSSTSLHLYSIE